MSLERVRFRWRDAWHLLADRPASSAFVAWLYAPVGIWAAYVTNWLRTETPTGAWWIIVVVGQFAVVVLLPLIGMAIHRWVEPRLRSAATFAGILATVVIRDRAVYVGAELLDVAPDLDLLTSLASVVSQTGLLLIIAIRVSARSREQSQLNDLAHVAASLAAEDQDLRMRVGDIDQRIAIQIGLTVEPRIRDLDDQLAEAERGGGVTRPLETLRSFVDDELLPLSHRLANAITPWSMDPRPALTSEGSAEDEYPRHLRAEVFIRPWLATGVIALLALPSVVSRVMGGLLATVVFAGIFGLVLVVVRTLLRHRSFPVLLAVVLSALLGGGASIVAVAVLSGPLSITQPRALIVGFAIGFSLGVLSAAAALQDERFRLTRNSLETRIEELEDSASTMRQQLWVSRRRFGYALHGGLQGALHAAMLRIVAADPPTAELISDVRADIRQAFLRATRESHEAPDLDVVCAEIAETWADSCDITWDISSCATASLRQSRIGAECTAEVIRETVQNAVRHGQASRVRIAAEMDDARLIVLVMDDGTWKGGDDGLGSRMLDEFCSRWVREPVEFGTHVRAEIVIPDQAGSDYGIEHSS